MKRKLLCIALALCLLIPAQLVSVDAWGVTHYYCIHEDEIVQDGDDYFGEGTNEGQIIGGTIRGTLKNCSVIIGGNIYADVTNESGGLIHLGWPTFYGEFTNNSGGIIKTGTFKGENPVINSGSITGGDFEHGITNKSGGVIAGSATVDGAIVNEPGGKIEGGTFKSGVENNGSITGGTFSGAVTGTGTITGGIFTGTVADTLTIADSAMVTVTFDSGVPAQKLLRGRTIQQPTVRRDGYTFGGWYNGDTLFDFTQPVTENVTLTAKWTLEEQFSPSVGETYYFDLSGVGLPGGKVNAALPDTTLHYVPFTFAGTVDAYKDGSDSYIHNLLIANYNILTGVSYKVDLLNKDYFGGREYAAGNLSYQLRVPSVGGYSSTTNEWDTILAKGSALIPNTDSLASIGSDLITETSPGSYSDYYCVVRGGSAGAADRSYVDPFDEYGYRPVLELLDAAALLGGDGLRGVTLELSGGKLGESGTIQILVKAGEGFAAPTASGLTRPAGNSDTYFAWQDEAGNIYAPGSTVPATVNTLCALWAAPTYTVTYAPGAHGTGASASDTKPTSEKLTLRGALFTRTGYTQVGWATEDGGAQVYDLAAGYTAARSVTLYPVWQVKGGYTVIIDTGTGKTQTTVKWTDKVLGSTADPVRDGWAFTGWRCGDTAVTADTTYADLTKDDTVMTRTVTAQWLDTAPPTGTIEIDSFRWMTVVDSTYISAYFDRPQRVTITAKDNSGMDVAVEYLISSVMLTQEDLAEKTFRPYTAPLDLAEDGSSYFYAKLTDAQGNVRYMGTSRVTLDTVAPVLTGITAGASYCQAVTATVSDANFHSLFVNDEPVQPDENGQFVLHPAKGTQTIQAYDRVGHCTEITVTVNDGHTGTATCTDKACCPVCRTVYGEIDENNHAGLKRVAAKAATKSAEGNIEYWYCADCGKYFSDESAAHEITQADTVTAKLPADAKTPTTGDSAAVVLWGALLLLSSGAVAVAVTLRRKNRG